MGEAGVRRAEDRGEARGAQGGQWAAGLAGGAGVRPLGRLTWPCSPGPAHGAAVPRLAARTLFVPRLSAFRRAGGAPCRPRRVVLQSALSPARGRPAAAWTVHCRRVSGDQRQDSAAAAAPGPGPSPRLAVRTPGPPGAAAVGPSAAARTATSTWRSQPDTEGAEAPSSRPAAPPGGAHARLCQVFIFF